MYQKKQDSVAVFGAGISGLSAAHELSERGYDVSVYEKLLEPGGVARSYRATPESAPSEYSWRGYGPWYHNIFDIMSKIPANGKPYFDLDGARTVYDNLNNPIPFLFTKNGGIYLMDGLSLQDNIVLRHELARTAAAGSKRKAHYATINASDYLKPRMSPEGWKIFISMFGPWVGIDHQRASHHHVMGFIVKNIIPGDPAPYYHQNKHGEVKTGSRSVWLAFNKPTNEAWFDPWVKHLKHNGVKFYFGYSLDSINCNGGRVTSMNVEGDDRLLTVKADQYVLAISPFGMHTVMENSITSRSNRNSSQDLSNRQNVCNDYFRKATKKFSNLIQDGHHIQVSFRLGFDKKIEWPGIQTPVILSDSEFNITMYRQEDFWDDDINLGPGIVSLWSGTACVSYVPGSLFGKSIVDLTKPEFKEEILHQLSKDVGFNDMLREKMGKNFQQLLHHMILFEVWKNWKFTDGIGKPKKITIMEPKYVDSTNTRPHQPDTITPISNLYLAGAHTKTSAELWSMEGAVESGRRAADMITGGNSTIVQDKGVVLKSLGAVDDVLYSMGMPNVVDILLIFIIVMFICIFSWYVFYQRKTTNIK